MQEMLLKQDSPPQEKQDLLPTTNTTTKMLLHQRRGLDNSPGPISSGPRTASSGDDHSARLALPSKPLRPMAPVERSMLDGNSMPPNLGIPKFSFTPNAILLLDDKDFEDGAQVGDLKEELRDFLWERFAKPHARLRSVGNTKTSKWENTATSKDDLDWDYHLRQVHVDGQEGPFLGGDGPTGSSSAKKDGDYGSPVSLHPALEKKIFGELDYEEMDVSKPLWKAYLVRLGGRVTTSDDRRVVRSCLLVRVHHAVCDGISGMRIADYFLNDLNEPADVLGQSMKKFKKNNNSSNSATFFTSWYQNANNPLVRVLCMPLMLILQLLFSIFRIPLMLFDIVSSFFAFLYMGARPRCTFCSFYKCTKSANGNIKEEMCSWGPRKVVIFPVLPFEVVRALKNNLNVTVNDVLTSAFAAAIGRYCAEACKDATFTGDKRKSAALRALTPMALTSGVKGASSEDQLTNAFTFLSTPLAVHLTEPIARLEYTKKTMDAFKKSFIGPLALSLTQATGKLLPQKFLANTVSDIFERNCVVLSNVPGYVVAGSDNAAVGGGQTVFPQEDFIRAANDGNDSPYRSLKVGNKRVRGLYLYYYNCQPQVILTSYQDKIFFTLVSDPAKIEDEDAIIRFYCEELYLLAEHCVKMRGCGDDNDAKILKRFLEQQPLPRALG
ncbi:unnamed protein product [Amoebophrya sp. A25]|nr:unnamed protein product [Amoebophrya sp. A25]|eukprot:GSA25T00022308001.1